MKQIATFSNVNYRVLTDEVNAWLKENRLSDILAVDFTTANQSNGSVIYFYTITYIPYVLCNH